MTENPQTLTAVIAEAALGRKALDLVGLDTRTVSSFADAFILATGTSNRHARAVADSIVEQAKAFGRNPQGMEGYDEGRWILIDFGDVIVHIFQKEVREYYDLERLWSEAAAIDFASMGLVLPTESGTNRSSRDVPQIPRAN